MFENTKALRLIAERKLSIAFSDYIVQVIDPTNKNTSYVAYHNEPKNNEGAVCVFESREHALVAALSACADNKQPNHNGLYLVRN